MQKLLIIALLLLTCTEVVVAQSGQWRQVEISESIIPDQADKPIQIVPFNDQHARRPFRQVEPGISSRFDVNGLSPFNNAGDPERGTFKAPTRAELLRLERQTSIGFFGTRLPFRYESPMLFRVGRSTSSQAVKAAWAKLQRSHYDLLILQAMDQARKLRVNDWGYYQLLTAAARQMYPGDKRAQAIFTTFCMEKSGYKVRLCDDGVRLYLAMPARQMIYQNTYFYEGSTRYFLLDPVSGSKKVRRLRVMDLPYARSGKVLDLSMRQTPDFEAHSRYRRLTFDYRGKKHSFSVPANKNLVAYYRTFPFTDLDIQGSAPLSAGARKALVRGLQPIIAGKSQQEAVAILLRFVQIAFPYQTDQKQFGNENYLFAEEMLYYPYSDCEDRSVLYAWLVEEMLGLETIGLVFPGHVATAVRFTERMTGDSITYKRQKYFICDPTYINAPPGRCLPSVINKRVEVVDL